MDSFNETKIIKVGLDTGLSDRNTFANDVQEGLRQLSDSLRVELPELSLQAGVVKDAITFYSKELPYFPEIPIFSD